MITRMRLMSPRLIISSKILLSPSPSFSKSLSVRTISLYKSCYNNKQNNNWSVDRLKFIDRHIDNRIKSEEKILNTLSISSEDELMNKVLPKSIKSDENSNVLLSSSDISNMIGGKWLKFTEGNAVNYLRGIVSKNNSDIKCYLGGGFYPSVIPSPIKKHILNNPAWYTAYTPYQSEISQGRLELLFYYQQMVSNITNLPLSNAGLLDEASSGAEAVTMLWNALTRKKDTRKLLISNNLFPATLESIKTRCYYLDIEYDIIDETNENSLVSLEEYFAMILQYPDKYGRVNTKIENIIKSANEANCKVACATDLMACHIIKSPGELGADVAFGNTQRFGLPLGFGGPHVSFFATKWNYLRQLPGKLVSYHKEDNNKIYRMALQTREQHIKKDKATSNICTSQVLLSNLSAMYAIYHGEKEMNNISKDIYNKTHYLASTLTNLGYDIKYSNYYDTIHINLEQNNNYDNNILLKLYQNLLDNNILTNYNVDENTISISISEITTLDDLYNIIDVFPDFINNYCDYNIQSVHSIKYDKWVEDINMDNTELSNVLREGDIYENVIFKDPKTETELLRMIKEWEAKDYSLNDGMIPLGSCTMKLNASSQLESLIRSDVANIHPYVPLEHCVGYREMMRELSIKLLTLTGMDNISYQSCSGAMGEYSGLITINKYLEYEKGIKFNRSNPLICLIPESAHGTNFASAIMAGYKIIKVKSNTNGELNLDDLRKCIDKAGNRLGCLMITYPSTYGFFDENILEVTQLIHEAGGQIYMDGANMNAMVGIMKIGELGADVAHLNLHKTFCIPHGGGGPGMGPIVIKKHLSPFLPTHTDKKFGYLGDDNKSSGVIASSPYSSASILTIPYIYLSTLSLDNLKKITYRAILNANYLKKRLEDYYKIKYKNENDFVAHEFIIDISEFKSIGINERDIAKRLMDFSFHPPTMSWPVSNSLMIEPTESESIEELDRFVDAMICIRQELEEIKDGIYDSENNVLKNAPHPIKDLFNEWKYSYSKEKAYYPIKQLKERKKFPAVNRVNDLDSDKYLLSKINKN